MTDHAPRSPAARLAWVQAADTAQERARRLMQALRGPDGCPWDIKQTHHSLRKYLLEECYELADAIDACENSPDPQQADADLLEELGDVYLQVLFHARIAEQEARFTMDDVADGLVQKMVERHPHVFAEEAAETAEDVLRNWEKGKRARDGRKRFGVGLPLAMPALSRGQTLSARAAQYGFDWENAEQVLDKVREETQEVAQALHEDTIRQEEEIGDLLLAVVNYARKLGLDAERCLQRANGKFQDRFEHVLVQVGVRDSHSLSPQDWDILWQRAKSTSE